MNLDTPGIIFKLTKRGTSKIALAFFITIITLITVLPTGMASAQAVGNDGCTHNANGAVISCPGDSTGGTTGTTGGGPTDQFGNPGTVTIQGDPITQNPGYAGPIDPNNSACFPLCGTYVDQLNNTNTNTANPYTGPGVSSNSQAAAYINGGKPTAATSTSQAQSLASCLGAKALGNFIKQQIGNVINTDKFKFVSVTSTQTDAQSGASNGFPPSWDSIAYCLLNEVITQVANQTIAWINSGFNGNPAFISDPKQFFSDLANYEAGSFIQQVAYGATGLNICQPFRAQIATGLNTTYNRGYGQASSCNLGTIGQNVQNFQAYTTGSPGSGAGSLQNLYSVGVQGQNPYNQYLLAQQELGRRIALQQNTATIDLSHGNGFLSYKECTPTPSTIEKGVTVKHPDTCKVVTPGKVIEDRVNSVTSAGTNRLVLADKFDQVVDALVNQLIKTTLNTVLQTTR